MTGWQSDEAPKPFAQAIDSMTAQAVHVGFRSNRVAGLASFDLDDCLNTGGGVIDEVALWALMELDTYTEVTPSGTSLRAYAIVEGEHELINTEKKVARSWGVVGRGIFFNAGKFVVHTAKPYHWSPNGEPVMTLKTITPDDLDLFRAAFWTFDRVPHSKYEAAQMVEALRANLVDEPTKVEPAKGGAVIEPKSVGQVKPGSSVIDAFNESVDLRAVMEMAGYTFTKDGRHFVRPGKKASEGVSGYFDGDHAFTFSSNDPLNVHCEKGNQVRAFDVLLEYQFAGDMKTAVREIAKTLGMGPKAVRS
jgi:hypothetical protein